MVSRPAIGDGKHRWLQKAPRINIRRRFGKVVYHLEGCMIGWRIVCNSACGSIGDIGQSAAEKILAVQFVAVLVEGMKALKVGTNGQLLKQ